MRTLNRKQILFIGVLVIAAAVAALLTYLAVKNSSINENTKAIFSDTEGTVYTDIEGNSVVLESYLGKIIVATSWASWSPFSAADLTALNELSGQESDEVVFLAINRKETKEQALRYLSTLPELPNLIIVLDAADQFYAAVEGYAMPETVVFDSRGEVVLHDRGAFSVERVQTALEAARGRE